MIGATAISVARALAGSGLDGRELARQAGVPAEAFRDPHTRFPSSTLDRLVALAAERSGDPAFGLTMAKHHRVLSRELHFAMTASETLIDAWRRMNRLGLMLSERLAFELENRRPGEVVVTFSVPEPDVGRWIPGDVMTATHVIAARGLTMNPELAPRRIEMRRPEPAALDRYEALFRCPLVFGCERNEVLWDKDVVEQPLPLSNAQLALKADGLIMEYVESWKDDDLVSRVRRLLFRELPDGVPGREEVARKLGLSPRSLSRGLAAAGTSYRVVLSDVRTTLAIAYLKDGSSITEIAFLLGFSETSAFCRAFRRWTGQSPTSYAASQVDG